MPLSISNSETLPIDLGAKSDRRWLTAWLLALVLTVSLYAGWEAFCRYHGLKPEPVSDTPELWAKTRDLASQQGQDATILIGASRIQLGINLDVLSQYTKHHPVQLAIDGSSFWPVLENLSLDNKITGTVIVSINMSTFARNSDVGRSAEWVAYYNEIKDSRGLYSDFEALLQHHFDAIFATRTSGIKPLQFNKLVGDDSRPYRQYLTMQRNRSRQADYSKVKIIEAYKARLESEHGDDGPVTTRVISDFEQRLARLEAMIQKIQQRGGRVILVRFPTDKLIWEIDNQKYPRKLYWDRLAASTAAETIHFMDYPQLSKFSLPDGSHLDYRDAIPFTESLAKLVFDK